MSIGPVTFAQPWLLLLLALPPLIALLRGARGQAPALVYSSLEPLRALGRARKARAGQWLTALLLLALSLMIVALARPQLGSTISRVEASGIDIMLVLDVSRSMLAEDFTIGGQRATRLEAVKNVTEQFIRERPHDRIGIVAFAARPYLVGPPTLNHDWLLKKLHLLRIGLVEDGTAIGSAIASGANRIRDRESKSKILVVLTDGDNNAGRISPNTAAQAARTLGLKIHTICAGSRGMAPIPVKDRFGRVHYQMVPVVVDEAALKQIADIGGGLFFRATDSESLREIYQEIDKLEKTTVEASITREYRDLFPPVLAAASALLIVSVLLSQTLWRKIP